MTAHTTLKAGSDGGRTREGAGGRKEREQEEEGRGDGVKRVEKEAGGLQSLTWLFLDLDRLNQERALHTIARSCSHLAMYNGSPCSLLPLFPSPLSSSSPLPSGLCRRRSANILFSEETGRRLGGFHLVSVKTSFPLVRVFICLSSSLQDLPSTHRLHRRQPRR